MWSVLLVARAVSRRNRSVQSTSFILPGPSTKVELQSRVSSPRPVAHCPHGMWRTRLFDALSRGHNPRKSSPHPTRFLQTVCNGTCQWKSVDRGLLDPIGFSLLTGWTDWTEDERRGLSQLSCSVRETTSQVCSDPWSGTLLQVLACPDVKLFSQASRDKVGSFLATVACRRGHLDKGVWSSVARCNATCRLPARAARVCGPVVLTLEHMVARQVDGGIEHMRCACGGAGCGRHVVEECGDDT